MSKCRNWFGVDVNNEESLFEYGFLMRYQGNGEYRVIYLTGFEDDKPVFAMGWFNPQEWQNDFIKSMNKNKYPDANEVASICGDSDGAHWLLGVKDNPQSMLSDILSCYSCQDVFGCNCYGSVFTETQIRKRLNRALA